MRGSQAFDLPIDGGGIKSIFHASNRTRPYANLVHSRYGHRREFAPKLLYWHRSSGHDNHCSVGFVMHTDRHSIKL